MMRSKEIVILVISLLLLEADTSQLKYLSAGVGMDSRAAWIGGYLPCARDLAVFPDYYSAILPLPSELSIGGFMLPIQGALLMAAESFITLGAGAKGLGTCASAERRAHLKPPKIRKWFDPRTWTDLPKKGSSNSSSIAISIVPEVDRIPCDDGHIVITTDNGPLSFDLENVQYLRLGQLIIAGSSISKIYLEELLNRDLGQLLFHNSRGITVEYYRDELCGCHKDFEKLVEPVCHNVDSECETAHCVDPTVILGACCDQCGASMTIPGGNCMERDRKDMMAFINGAITEQGLTDDLQVHVHYLSSSFNKILQVIILDRVGYSERSVEFMRYLEATRNQSSLLARKPQVIFSYAGRPYNPNVTFASVLLILFCLVLVTVVSIIMLAHFMPQNPYLNRIPQWIHDPRRWRWHNLSLRLRRNLLFNRFDNAAPGIATSSGRALERSAVMGFNAETGEVRERAFDNPMFEQEHEQELPRELQPSENIPEAGAVMVPKVETGELDNCSVEEQELTEINLEASESESDAEEETKE